MQPRNDAYWSRVYDILVQEAGAREELRTYFIRIADDSRTDQAGMLYQFVGRRDGVFTLTVGANNGTLSIVCATLPNLPPNKTIVSRVQQRLENL